MRIEGRSGGYGGGNDIRAGSNSFRTVKVTRYLCGSCGFSEEWIDAPEDLHKLKEKYGSSESTARLRRLAKYIIPLSSAFCYTLKFQTDALPLSVVC